MSLSAVKLLIAARDILGGDEALARRLDISPTLLARFMSGARELPVPLLLQAVDIVLEDETVPAAALQLQGLQDSVPDR